MISHSAKCVFALAAVVVASCSRAHRPEGEELARANCSICHAFPEPQLLDKRTWLSGVLPQMAPRLGVTTNSLFDETSRDPNMVVLPTRLSQQDWQKIVEYYRTLAPDSLPYQALPSEPQLDPAFFKTSAFAEGLKSSGIVTLIKIDSVHQRIFIGDGGNNTLSVFDWNRRLKSTLALKSAPTDVIVEGNSVYVLEAGILNPNDQPAGSLVRYELDGRDSLRLSGVVIDSLFRPVFVRAFDFLGNGQNEFVICEFGNNRGRLSLYTPIGAATNQRQEGEDAQGLQGAPRYERQILDPGPGAIRFEIRDLTGDGAPDIVALFGQANERIVLYENDGHGHFPRGERVLVRFPPVYGSMFFSIHDFNGDGHPDILYVNGDNFDYSRVLKPYHGVRILENDGKNNFRERFFFPIYGAARAEVADFDGDGDLDILATSNFADFRRHPERGIIFLENVGGYNFKPYAFTVAATNQWNLTAVADLNKDGKPDLIIGAMDLGSIRRMQQQYSAGGLSGVKDPILFFENRTQAK